MQRLTDQRYATAIGTGYAAAPPGIAARLMGVHWFTGTNPAWAGLHFIEAPKGNGYTNPVPYAVAAHTLYPFHLTHRPAADRLPTIVLPLPWAATPETVVHELGHVLHMIAGFEYEAAPVSGYAAANRYEAFAEAFCAWVLPGTPGDRWDRDAAQQDRQTRALFERLAG